MSDYIYVLKAGDFYKIGRTASLHERIKRLSIQLPFPIKLVMAFEVDDATDEEGFWHSELEDKRINGEWFELNEDDVKALGDYIAENALPSWVWAKRFGDARAMRQEHEVGDGR